MFKDVLCKTEFWLSESAMEQIEEHCDDRPVAFLAKVRGFAQGGFWNYEGEESVAIRHEWENAYRIRHKYKSEFRLIGFYEGSHKKVFIALDGFLKKKKYTNRQWQRIQEVSGVKDRDDWEKVR